MIDFQKISGNLEDYESKPVKVVILFCTGDRLCFESIGFDIKYDETGQMSRLNIGKVIKGPVPAYLNLNDISAITVN